MKGKFIVLEGINGCGKTTQAEILAGKMFEDVKPYGVFLTREPNAYNDDRCGLDAIDILKSDGDPYINAERAVSCFAINRQKHSKLISSLLRKGIFVVSDRYWPSNFAFQHAQGVSHEHIAMLNSGSKVPDATIILDVPVEIAFERLARRDESERRKFDRSRDFLEKVRNNYLELPYILRTYMNEKNIFVVDGVGSLEEVSEKVISVYNSLFKS